MCCIIPKKDGNRLGNFDIKIQRVVNIHDHPQGDGIPHVEISLAFEKGEPSKMVRVALSELAAIRWNTIDYRASFSPDVAVTTANRYLLDAIRSSLDGLPMVEVYQLSHPGLYKIAGRPVFCTGGGVIRPPASAAQEPEIECESMPPQRLDIDPGLSEVEAVAEMLNLISLFPNPGRVILSQVLVALLRQAYEDAGSRPAFCVFLHGHTGTQKTTIASFLTQIYNRNDGIAELTRLNASCAAAVEMLMDTTDQVKVFDDLFPAASPQVRKDQEKVLAEITRYIADGTIPARMKGRKVREGHPMCGLLFTGEYLIGEGSDAARLLPVKMTKPNTAALSYFQARPLIASTFYHNFIVWFIENYDKIVSYLKEWLDEYRKTDLGVHDRLRETHFFLNTAYVLLLEYCMEKGVLTEEEVRQLHSSFAGLLTQLVREQNERVSPTTSMPPSQGNILERIRELYRSERLSIPHNKRLFNDQEYDGVVHKDCLCLRPQALSRIFPSWEIDGIAHELEVQGALNKGKDGPTKKISAASGKYFYCIPLSCLS